MKNFKKLAGILLALTIALSMTAGAYAQNTTETGSITINDISAEGTYEVYLLLDLESYSTEGKGAYSYKVNEDWTGFFATDTAKTYVTIADDGYVTWTGSEEDLDVAAFAKDALAYAEANGIEPTQSSLNEGEFQTVGTTGKFINLPLGYYLVDSTMGALCGLTTTNPNASINAKNAKPTIDKQVKEDSTNQWAEFNTADIGQTVEYRVTINVHAGAQNYILHDVMSEGLTFKGIDRIEHIVPGTDTHEVAATEYTLKNTEDGDPANHPEDGCTFEIKFTKEFCDHLQTNDKIVVYYSAMLNRNAVIADEGNPNKAKLEYGEKHFTSEDSVPTRTFGIDIVKTDSQNTLLKGAKFRIYDAAVGGNEVAVVLMDDGVTYRRARADETGVEIDVNDGRVRVVGMDNGTYYLEETEAPEGFHILSTRQMFKISDSNLYATFNDGIYSTGSGVHVVNKTGTMLPQTGGMGTTLFYVAGGVLVAAAVVLLITRRRMSAK